MDIVAELKKVYLNVKRESDNFSAPLGETYTGDELYHLTIKLQTLHSQIPVTVLIDDLKWIAKLMNYIQPYTYDVTKCN